jgi:hypothetical protein
MGRLRYGVLTGVLLAAACGGRRDTSEPEAPPPPTKQPGHRPEAPQQQYRSVPPPLPGKAVPRGGAKPVGSVAEAEAALAGSEAELDGLLAKTGALSTDRCARMCAALASMRSAVDNLCSLTSETDERCTSARKRLEKSEQRVTDAGCSC